MNVPKDSRWYHYFGRALYAMLTVKKFEHLGSSGERRALLPTLSSGRQAGIPSLGPSASGRALIWNEFHSPESICTGSHHQQSGGGWITAQAEEQQSQYTYTHTHTYWCSLNHPQQWHANEQLSCQVRSLYARAPSVLRRFPTLLAGTDAAATFSVCCRRQRRRQLRLPNNKMSTLQQQQQQQRKQGKWLKSTAAAVAAAAQ